MKLGRFAIALGFVAGGILHFTKTRMYEQICPGYLPNHRALVLISGAAEIAGGLGILIPQTRQAAGWGLLALLLAVFPANINMAVNARDYARVAPVWALWLRLPLQFVLMAWVKKAAIPATRE
jgi:uncharacterized membrane protein